jgi:glycerol-3-phosphate dehydrogenase
LSRLWWTILIMHNLKTEVLIIGGGATGTGLVRDLAMRGFKVILVEQGDLATGTTGRYHGLLHSGGRYVVKDPLAAKECIEENRILRRIMPECIEDTGGFFTLTPYDDPTYTDTFILGCHQAGIPCEEVTISAMLRTEPMLNPHITRCFRVPDASADSFLAADMNANSAREYGATILRYHPVQRLLTSGQRQLTFDSSKAVQPPTDICGAICRDLVKDEEVRIDADLVVNAAGAWVGKIAATAGISVQMTPGKGILLAINHRVVNTVINRCKMPGDGDIIVPAHTVAVIGTTDVKVTDPDHYAIESWEVKLMLEEGEKLIPGFRDLRFLRAWAGVRPLYQEAITQNGGDASGNRDITRAFVLLDHTIRDDVNGLLTITSGKWTTYRKMAEVTADKVCEKLGVQRPCRTHLESLPSKSRQTRSFNKGILKTLKRGQYHHLGHRLEQIEAKQSYGTLICECELATREDITRVILDNDVNTLDDIRRDIRMGMGPCQAGFCALRSAGMLHQLRHSDSSPSIENGQKYSVDLTNSSLRDFLQERWKGVQPILWGQQLRQERLNELVYLNVLNASHLSGPEETRLSPTMYEQEPEDSGTRKLENTSDIHTNSTITPLPESAKTSHKSEILIIGAGLAGLLAAWQVLAIGKKVKLISKGFGATHWGAGCIDVLGYYPLDQGKPVGSPIETLSRLVREQPHHPYTLAGLQSLELAIRNIQDTFNQSGYPLHGSISENWLLPTALGTVRPTCLAPETMVAGDLRCHEPMLIVGFEQFLDFHPALVAANLCSQDIHALGIVIDLPSLEKRRFVNAIALARLFDQPEFRAEVVKTIKPRLGKATRVGFPAVLGLQHPIEVIHDLQARLGCPVFEIPGLPPSIPGIRMVDFLTRIIQRAGGWIYNGMQVIGANGSGNHLQVVLTDAGNKQVAHPAEIFVLATGGILGGGITTTPPGSGKEPVYESALGLPIQVTCDRRDWFHQEFLGAKGHPIFMAGLKVNEHFQPVNGADLPFYNNLFAIGGALAHYDPIRERSLEGVAVVTGFSVGQRVRL